MSKHTYNTAFMEVASQSRHSADRIIDIVLRELDVASVADFGCARGTWLSAWRDRGIADVVGVDGEYLAGQPVEIDRSLIKLTDLERPIDLDRRFDLVESLEVAEHLKAEAAPVFVETLTRHADVVLFSAAPPGQGGEYHVNEQPYAYWRDLFSKHGYAMFDCIRPAIRHDRSIRYWYRFNVFLCANAAGQARLPPSVLTTRVATEGDVEDVSPFVFRMRKLAIRNLPIGAQNGIASMLSRIRSQ